MMSRRVLWVARCIDRSGSSSAQQRKDHMEAHFSYIETIIDSIAFAGPVTSEDGDKIIGSMLAFYTEELEDFHARVVQHEKDHLDGVLFPDRLTSPISFGFTDELKADGRIP